MYPGTTTTEGAGLYFVEMGAFDGIHISNTLALERDVGWRGLCVEVGRRRLTSHISLTQCS